jgi:pyruvate,orthophosphate dikinase
MIIADKFRKIGVRTNADTPADEKIASEYGAEGIGLFRIEYIVENFSLIIYIF